MGGNEWWHSTAGGVIGGVCCVYAGQPFDTIKVRLQTQPLNAPKTFNGPIDCLIKTVKSQGLRSLYRGSTPALASVVTENAVLFTANAFIKKAFMAMGAGEELTLGQHAIAGGLAGVFSSTAICPAEVVKCTLQAQMALHQQRMAGPAVTTASASSSVASTTTAFARNAVSALSVANMTPAKAMSTIASSAQVPRPSPIAVVSHIFRTEGVRGFFKGLPSLWARDIPFNFAFLGSYETFLYLFAYQKGVARNDLDAGALFVSGGLAGMTGWSVVFPFDSIKSRVQSAPKGMSAGKLALQMLRHEGVRAFYTGWSTAVMRAFPANAALLLGFELSHRLFD